MPMMPSVKAKIESAIFYDDPLQHIGNVLDAIGSLFEHLVYFFPTDKVKEVVAAIDDVDERIAQHTVAIILKGIDFDDMRVHQSEVLLFPQVRHREMQFVGATANDPR